jgi:N-acetyl-anhydromuramyl-L-alanine amidase AmpD
VLEPTWQNLKRARDGGAINPNLYTLGIEHEGRPKDPWTDEMYAATAELIAGMLERHPGLHPFDRDRLVLHREIFAGKICPGLQFDPDRLLREVEQAAAARPSKPLTA